LSLIGNGEFSAGLRAVGGDIGNRRRFNLPGWRHRLIAVRLRRMVLCRRHGWHRAIVSIFTGNRMVHKVRAIHDQRATIVTELITVRTAPDG